MPQYGYPYPPPPGTNGLAIAALVLGILWLYWIGSALAVIFGFVALSQIRQRHQQGRGIAIAGIVLGFVGIAAAAAVAVVVAVAVHDAGNSSGNTLSGNAVASYIDDQFQTAGTTCPDSPTVAGYVLQCTDTDGRQYTVTVTSSSGDYTVQAQ